MDSIIDLFDIIDDPDVGLLDYVIPHREYELRTRTDHYTKWNDAEFYNRFRLSKPTVSFLLQQIERDLQNRTNWNAGRAVSTRDKLLLTLRFLASGDFYISIGDFVGIHKSTAGRIIKQGINAICNLFHRYVQLPQTEDEKTAAKRDFYNIAHFPRVIGAIDCTHIKIQSPGGNDAEVYRYRKGFFSLNCQVVGSANLKILDIVCRWPGSANDSHIFESSGMRMRIRRGELGNGVLIADRGYAVKTYIQTPLDYPRNEVQSLYNESLIRTRNTIERLFGVWKKRFPILSLGIRCETSLAQKIISACAILHNIAIERNEEIFDIEEDTSEGFQGNEINEDITDEDDARGIFMDYFRNLLNNGNTN